MALKTKNQKALGKGKGMKIPSKRTMNFIHHQSSFNARRMVPTIVVLVLVTGALVKFGIIDPTTEKMRAYDELAAKQEQLSALNRALSGYDQVAYDYGRYSYGWLNEEEVNMVGRLDVLELIEELIVPKCTIENTSINDNVITMDVHGLTLQQASDMVMVLETNELVQSATVYNAVADEAVDAKINLSIIVEKPAEEAE